MKSIGFIGAGRMAQALAKGFISAEIVPPKSIMASCPEADKKFLDIFKSWDCQVTHDNRELVEGSEVILLAVKPVVMGGVLKDINPIVQPKHLIVSTAAGVQIKSMEMLLPEKTRVIRTMPNTPALVRAGATVFVCGNAVKEGDAEIATKLFSAVGMCDEVSESMIDAVTGISGCGPAYIFQIIEGLADGGVKMGLPRDLSIHLAAQTVLGAARMVLEVDRHTGALKDDVCSPGGATISAVHFLEKCQIRAAMTGAVEQATLTSWNKGKAFSKPDGKAHSIGFASKP